MRYRRFGSLDWDVSAFGMGAGGLPCPDSWSDGSAEAAATESVRMVRYAVDRGVNYLDLGHPYDMARQQWMAKTIGRALGSGYRDKTRISVTVPVSAAESCGGFRHCLDAQLEWLGVDSVDFCVLSTLDRETWPRLREARLLEQAEQAVAEGRVRYLGFGFRDQFQVLKQVLEEYGKWSLAQFRLSYMDTHDPGAVGLGYAAERGIAVVATQPLKAGRLAPARPEETVGKVWAATNRAWSPAEWALRWAWNHQTVSTVVCDVGDLTQLRECLAVAGEAEAGSLTVRDQLTINRVRDAYQLRRPIDCASCRPCLPCPQGIDIPRVFELYNDAIMYRDRGTASRMYTEEEHHADRCNECGLCESRCCQSPPLPIRDWLVTAHELLQGQ